MSTTYFSSTEHTIPCQYIREYPNAVKSDDVALKLVVKEYRPLDPATENAPNAVTIIAAHGNGFPKETYEPLFDDLCELLRGKIRSIWIADCSNQGASGLLNEEIQGDDRELNNGRSENTPLEMLPFSDLRIWQLAGSITPEICCA